MALILPSQFTQQPQYPAKPSTRFPGLVGLWNFANDINAITGKASTGSTSAKKSFYTSGINEEVTGTSYSSRYALENIPSAGANDFTVAIQFRPKNSGGYTAFGKYAFSNPTASEWFIGAAQSFNGITAGFSVVVGANVYSANITSTSWTLNNDYILIGRRRGTTLFFDRYNLTAGAHDSATTTDAGITTINSTSTPLVLGELSGGVSYTTDMATPWAAIFNRSISDAEVAAIAKNPWRLFNAPVLNIWPYSAGSSNVTIAITGNSATGSIGSLIIGDGEALSGNSATGAIGSLSVTSQEILSGNSATGFSGSTSSQLSLSLTGSGATGYAGTLTASGSSSLTIALTGNSCTGSAGSFITTNSVAVSGNTSQAGIGSIAPTLSFVPNGNAAQSAAGSVSSTTALPIIGLGATAIIGSVAPVLTFVAAGNTSTGYAGNVQVASGYYAALAGVEALAAIGSVGNARIVQLSGNSAAGYAGTLYIPQVLTLALTGNQATEGLGSLSGQHGFVLNGVSGQASSGPVNPSIVLSLIGSPAFGSSGTIHIQTEFTPAIDTRFIAHSLSMNFIAHSLSMNFTAVD